MKYWFWVAKSDAYIGEEGKEDVWGDCGSEVEPGDLALIYRKSPPNKEYMIDRYSIIESLVQITSPPKKDCEIETERGVPKSGHCCGYKVLHNFEYGLEYKEMIIYRDELKSALTDWVALKKNFQGMYHPVDEDSWNKLDQLLIEKNEGTYPGFKAYN